MSNNIKNKQKKSYTFYTVLATVSPKIFLNDYNNANFMTVVLWFQLFVILTQLFLIYSTYFR